MKDHSGVHFDIVQNSITHFQIRRTVYLMLIRTEGKNIVFFNFTDFALILNFAKHSTKVNQCDTSPFLFNSH